MTLLQTANGAGVVMNYAGGDSGNTGRIVMNCVPGAPGISNVRFVDIVRVLECDCGSNWAMLIF